MNIYKIPIQIIAYIVLITFCLISIPEFSLALSADGKAIDGMKLYRKGVFDQASKKFKEARQGKPNDPKLSYNLGNSYYKQGLFEKALEGYSKLDGSEKNSSLKQKSNYNIGNTLFRMNKLEKSIEAYKRALVLDPSDIDAKFNLEFVRQQLNKENNKKKSDKTKNQQKNNPKNKTNDKQQNQTKAKVDNKNKSKQNDQTYKEDQKVNNSNEKPFLAKKPIEEKMSQKQAKQKLSSLNEDLKKFQRKQALDMKSFFTYQGKNW